MRASQKKRGTIGSSACATAFLRKYWPSVDCSLWQPISHQLSTQKRTECSFSRTCSGISLLPQKPPCCETFISPMPHGCMPINFYHLVVNFVDKDDRYNVISLPQFNENAFFVFYTTPGPEGPIDDHLRSHQLALMFMVLAIGSLMDTKRPAYNIEAERYHQLARASLFQSPIFEEPTLNAVQTLVGTFRIRLLVFHS